jgi:predicted lipid-binding transport protein (Tim44 family)
MSDAIPYADILILALVAGFILLRLRSVLGTRIGNDDPEFMRPMPKSRPEEPIIQLGDKPNKFKIREIEPDPYLQNLKEKDVADALAAVKLKDPGFVATTFLTGARMAYEMVFDAFAKDDKQTLKMLLADDIQKHFVSEMEAREQADSRSETTLVAVSAKDITKVTLNGNIAQLTVKFLTEQVTVVRDKDGKIIEGDASRVVHGEDEWVFERDITSKNPNWKIIET